MIRPRTEEERERCITILREKLAKFRRKQRECADRFVQLGIVVEKIRTELTSLIDVPLRGHEDDGANVDSGASLSRQDENPPMYSTPRS